MLILVPTAEAVLLKKKIDETTILAVPTALIGLFLIYQPDFIFHTNNAHQTANGIDLYNSSDGNLLNNQSDQFLQDMLISNSSSSHGYFDISFKTMGRLVENYGVGVGIISITCFSMTVAVLARVATEMNQSSSILVSFYAFLIASLFSIIPMLILEKPKLPSSFKNYMYITAHLCSSLINDLTYLEALKLTHGYIFTIIVTSGIPMMLGCQYTVLRHILPGHQNIWEVLGVILVTVATMFLPVLQIFRMRIKDKT